MADSGKLDYIQERVDTVVDRVAEVGRTVEGVKTSLEHHIQEEADMKSDISRMADALNENTHSLKEHMRRTDLLEEYVKSVDARFTPLELEQQRKKAIKSWISGQMKLIAKLGAAISAAGALALVVKKLLEYLLSLPS